MDRDWNAVMNCVRVRVEEYKGYTELERHGYRLRLTGFRRGYGNGAPLVP